MLELIKTTAIGLGVFFAYCLVVAVFSHNPFEGMLWACGILAFYLFIYKPVKAFEEMDNRIDELTMRVRELEQRTPPQFHL